MLLKTDPSGYLEDGTIAVENVNFRNFNIMPLPPPKKINLSFSPRILDSGNDKIIDSSGHLTVFSIFTRIGDVIHSSGLRIFAKIIGN